MGDSVRPDWSGRLRRVWRTIPPAASEISALVVSTPTNIRYLCGFDGSAGLLVTCPGLREPDAWLIVDGRYEQASRQALADDSLGPVRIRAVTGSFHRGLVDLLAGLAPGPVGFEAEHVSVATLEAWEGACPDRTFIDTARWIEALRLIKDPFELEALSRVCSRVASVARELVNWVRAGRTEAEIAADIDTAMRRAGCARPAFETIVASGPNSALPHARPTDRRLSQGDLVVLDFGGVLDGYCGDLTRMAGVGRVKAEARSLFEAVRAAHGAALAAVRAEALASEVDAAARRVLTTHGFGDAILHATGHGLGMDVHEAPRLGRPGSDAPMPSDNPDRLEAGMVCTIEPGAYVAGVGGVRLEDDVVVTTGGCEVLTDAPRDLLSV